MTEDKIALIDKICKLHPSLGVDKGWSEYTGGMKDSGEWYFRRMLDVPISELGGFYLLQMKLQKDQKASQLKREGEFKASGMTVNEWNTIEFTEMKKQIHKDMADLVFKDYISDGKLIKPKESGND